MQEAHLNVERSRDTPPPVFCKKSLQAIENKEREFEKERKERQRGGKLLRTWGLP
jgi:hypothetical protein